MKTLLKISAICLMLAAAAPSFAQVSWGVDLRFGTPPPPRREVIVERPYPDAVWGPGYYNYVGTRYVWFPGRWHERGWNAPQRYYGGDRDRGFRGEGNWNRDGGDRGRGRDGGRDRQDFQRGRIR
jgi:hypothetical protein